MEKKVYLFIIILIGLFNISIVSSELFGYNLLEEETFNNNTAFVNSSAHWVTTSLGILSDANSTQFNAVAQVLNIDESWIDSLWCRLTGCTMTGDIDMSNNSITNILSTQYNISGCSDNTEGTFCYDSNYDTMRFVTISGQILQMNQETTMPTKNIEGSTVADGSIVYIMGATGANPNFKLGKADQLNTSGLVGVVTKECINNQVCPVVFFGLIHEFDTSSFVAGDHLYISATVAGNFTTTPPEFPNVPIWVATVVRVHPNEGTIFVFPQLDSANGITMNTLGLVGDFIQTDYKIMSLSGNAAIGQNVFTIQMNGTTGIDIPHLVLQPGGSGQASVWVRSGIVVPESVLCLNTTNRTEPTCFADEAGFVWQILDFDTSIAEGADWGITGELEIVKNVYVHGNITVNTSIFFGDSDHFLRRGAIGFDGLSNNAFAFQQNVEHPEGTVPFIVTANKTNSDNDAVLIMAQIGLNESNSVLGNSWIIVVNNLTNNLTQYSKCFLVAGLLNKTLRVQCDSGESGADLIVQDDIQSFGTMFADGGIRAETLVDFIMNGRDVNIENGSLHIFTPVEFTSGVTEGDDITTFNEFFVGGLGSFKNLQIDLGNWFPTSNIFCDDGDCANAIGISGTGNIIMEANISTININSTSLNFVYSLVNMLGGSTFTVTANNNVGSGEVTLLTDSTNDVVLSSQSISMPSSMSNQPLVSIRFECDVTNTNRQCFVDTISVNGTAITTTLTNQSGFNSQVCAGDGTKNSGGVCNNGWFYNASENAIFPQGAWNLSGASIVGVSHSALTNLEWASAGHTFSSSNQVMNIGSYNFTTTGMGTFANGLFTEANDGGDTSITIRNSAASGSSDETVSLLFETSTILRMGKIVAAREGPYAPGGNQLSSLNFYTTRTGTNLLALTIDENQDFDFQEGEMIIGGNATFGNYVLVNNSLGVGTFSPQAELEVQGDFMISNSFSPTSFNVVVEPTAVGPSRIAYISYVNGLLSGKVKSLVWGHNGFIGVGVNVPATELEVNGSMSLYNDNDIYYRGRANDAGDFYNGTDWIFNSRFVGSGNYIFTEGDVIIENDLNVLGNYSHNGTIGFTGDCVNTTYSGGIAISCND